MPATHDRVPAIDTDGLTKRFGDLTALDRLSITVDRGEIYGFLGPNGAGKTTSIRIFLGLARPTAGHARIFGSDVESDRRGALAHIAYVPGEFNAWPTLRGSEMLDLLGSLHGGYDRARRDALIQQFEFDPTKRGREYSKGNRQKIAIIAAFMTDVDLLVLDEPTSGLDPLMEVAFRACVEDARKRGQTVFLSSHILSEVEALCDRVAILRSGRLVDVGTLDDLRAINAREVKLTFNTAPSVDLARVPGVEQLEVDGLDVTFRLRGEPSGLLRALAGEDVHSMDIREPSLEELFLSFYREDQATTPSPGPPPAPE